MKRILKILAIIVGVLIVIAIAIPFFIDANTFRPKLESELTDALGRPVKVGNLSLSLLSGSVSADDISIADDPAFSKSDVRASEVAQSGRGDDPADFLEDTERDRTDAEPARDQPGEIGERREVEFLEPRRKKSLRVETCGLPCPFLRGNPNLSVAKLNVNDGRLTVSRAGSGEKPHVYDKVNIEVTNFSFTSSFPFKMTAQLPADGSLKLDGKAGPIDAEQRRRDSARSQGDRSRR